MNLINKFLRDASQQTSQDTVLLKRCRRSGLGFPKAEVLNISNTPHRELIPNIPGSQELNRGYWTQKHWKNTKNCLETNLSAFPECPFRQHFRSYRFWKLILGALRGVSRSGIDF